MNIKEIITLFSVFTIIDVIGISLTTKPLWEKLVLKMTNKPLKINYLSASFSYILLGFGLYFLSFVHIRPEYKLIDSIYYGVLFGLVVYGTFDFTNMSLFADYDWTLGFIDILWGIFVSTLTLIITSHLLL